MTRPLAAVLAVVLALPLAAAETPDSLGAKNTREKKLAAKLPSDIEKKMLRPLIQDDLPAAIKMATGQTLRIELVPGAGVTLTSSFGPFKKDMTLEEVLNAICDDRGWGWYVNSTKVGDQKDGAIYLSTNPKERGYKEGTGPKEMGKKDEPKDPKTKPKEEPKATDADRAANDLLAKAKLQNNLKQTEKAKATLAEIIEKYPDTKAAADAKKLLEKIGK